MAGLRDCCQVLLARNTNRRQCRPASALPVAARRPTQTAPHQEPHNKRHACLHRTCRPAHAANNTMTRRTRITRDSTQHTTQNNKTTLTARAHRTPQAQKGRRQWTAICRAPAHLAVQEDGLRRPQCAPRQRMARLGHRNANVHPAGATLLAKQRDTQNACGDLVD